MKLNKKKILSIFLIIFITVNLLAIFLGFLFYYDTQKKYSDFSVLKEYHPSIVTTLYSDQDKKVAEFYREKRRIVPIYEMPPLLKDAFVATEDSKFYQHNGIDFSGILRAFAKNLRAGRIVQGGSTITQQVAKYFFLSSERTYIRKFKEAILALKIEKKFSKEEILYFYLNQIYLGHGAYGVVSAAENYFGKQVQDLNLAECAILAALPKAPALYSPFHHFKRAKRRQEYILRRMLQDGKITQEELKQAIDFPLNIRRQRNWYLENAPYYSEYIRQYVEKTYGNDLLYEGGLKIYSSINLKMQKQAQKALAKGLEKIDKRQGFKGAIGHLHQEEIEDFLNQYDEEVKSLKKGDLAKAVVYKIEDSQKVVYVKIGQRESEIHVSDAKWASRFDPKVIYYKRRLKQFSDILEVGDIIWVKIQEKTDDVLKVKLDQIPTTQGAILCLELKSGDVKVMVGGSDFALSKFNRAIQAKRQAGSVFKPIIYAAALDKNYSPATIIVDSPIVFKDKENDLIWKPKNYKGSFRGPTSFRDALTTSNNTVTIKILQDIGVDYVIDYAKRFGIESKLNRDLSMSLGSSSVSLFEMVRAFSVFANLGKLIEPNFIKKIVTPDGRTLEENQVVQGKQIIEESTAYIITSILQSVVQRGTARQVRELKMPIAGKTGTTNNLFDAWFIGYSPDYIIGVWVGFDKESSLGEGETGSQAAIPIWLDFAEELFKNEDVKDFIVPDSVVFAKIDTKTGLLAIPESKHTRYECFKKGTSPKLYTKKKNKVVKEEDFFKALN